MISSWCSWASIEYFLLLLHGHLAFHLLQLGAFEGLAPDNVKLAAELSRSADHLLVADLFADLGDRLFAIARHRPVAGEIFQAARSSRSQAAKPWPALSDQGSGRSGNARANGAGVQHLASCNRWRRSPERMRIIHFDQAWMAYFRIRPLNPFHCFLPAWQSARDCRP